MIEINLLPAEFRPREKTNVPLMATVAVGMVVVGAIILWGIDLKRELGRLKGEHSDLLKEKQSLEEDVAKVKALRDKIKRQKARQDTIIEISQSKVMWSLKLQQLASIMDRFKNFWVKSLVLAKSRGGRALRLDTEATGSNLREVARFRDALKADPNFFYHFGGLEGYSVKINELPEGKYNFPSTMVMQLTLPLESAGDGKKKKKKRRR